MSELEKIKEIAKQMPESPEKQSALQSYSNLKLFEVIADSFESLIEKPTELEKAAKKAARTGSQRDLKAYLKLRKQNR